MFFPNSQGFDYGGSDLSQDSVVTLKKKNAGDTSSLTCIKEEEREDKFDNVLLSKKKKKCVCATAVVLALTHIQWGHCSALAALSM